MNIESALKITLEETIKHERSEVLAYLKQRVERAEDQILTAATQREKDTAIIRYETIRDTYMSMVDRLPLT